MEIYPVTSNEISRRVSAAIRHVFMSVWDPIGVRDSPNAQDEYDDYIGRAFELLMANVSDSDLETYLIGVVEGMGMDRSRSSHADVIRALRAINLTQLPDHP
jgi:hypothetical protein